MINRILLVGRIAEKVNLKEDNDGKLSADITVAVPQEHKNSEGTYETDLINCIIYGNSAKNIAEYCEIGDLVGIKGSLKMFSSGEKESHKIMKVAIEKLTCLQTQKEKKETMER